MSTRVLTPSSLNYYGNSETSIDLSDVAAACPDLEDLQLTWFNDVDLSIIWRKLLFQPTPSQELHNRGIKELAIGGSQSVLGLSACLKDRSYRVSRDLLKLEVATREEGKSSAYINALKAHDKDPLPLVKEKFPLHSKSAMISVVMSSDGANRNVCQKNAVHLLDSVLLGFIFKFAATPEQRPVEVGSMWGIRAPYWFGVVVFEHFGSDEQILLDQTKNLRGTVEHFIRRRRHASAKPIHQPTQTRQIHGLSLTPAALPGQFAQEATADQRTLNIIPDISVTGLSLAFISSNSKVKHAKPVSARALVIFGTLSWSTIALYVLAPLTNARDSAPLTVQWPELGAEMDNSRDFHLEQFPQLTRKSTSVNTFSVFFFTRQVLLPQSLTSPRAPAPSQLRDAVLAKFPLFWVHNLYLSMAWLKSGEQTHGPSGQPNNCPHVTEACVAAGFREDKDPAGSSSTR
ncbi:hypothetical protein ON010_g413 [Phytophthora cinnamomi]|nr:hypothetical protein ON010_g413 [Phytophthora cinnamomi]